MCETGTHQPVHGAGVGLPGHRAPTPPADALRTDDDHYAAAREQGRRRTDRLRQPSLSKGNSEPTLLPTLNGLFSFVIRQFFIPKAFG